MDSWFHSSERNIGSGGSGVDGLPLALCFGR